MFEKAARLKLRFQTSKGLLTVEDLFDLPLTSQTGKANLNGIAVALHNKLRVDLSVSFVEPAKANEADEVAFEIVKHIITTKIAERDAAAAAAAKKEAKQKIMALIDQKQNEALGAKSLDELQELLKSM